MRFIPVGTGNTAFKLIVVYLATVHPRGHGEHIDGAQLVQSLIGSSPWARGTLYIVAAGFIFVRFIPVGTGNTLLDSWSWLLIPVHPRGHGEHFWLLTPSLARGGSSPWARGTHDNQFCSNSIIRFIPVGTGNTVFCIHPG